MSDSENWGSSSYNFDMPQMGSQSFDYDEVANFGDLNNGAYGGSFYNPDVYGAPGFDCLEDEPPLLEELGINPDLILQKTLAVLNPFRKTDQMISQDTDLAGPLVFCLTLGSFLLLSGKVHFSFIYGIGVMGCLSFYVLLSVMPTQSSVTWCAVVSILGYCLLPMVILSGINVLITLKGIFGVVLAAASILWCSVSASKLFVTVCSMEDQRVLIAYPCALLYGVFALITIF